MDVELIVVCSIVLQFTTSILALRLIPLTGRKKAWVTISAAFFLMGFRRLITLWHLGGLHPGCSVDVSAEWVSLVTSSLMLLGVVWIAPIFVGIQRSALALKESEKEYRTLFEGCKDPVYVTSREGRFVDINPAGLELFGYSREEMQALDVPGIYARPEDRRRFQAEIEKHGAVKDYALDFVKKDGTRIDCLLTSTVQLSSEGAVMGYRGIIRDVTEQKRVARLLETERNRFFSLLDNLPAIVSLHSADYSVRYCNSRFREIFGLPDGRPCHVIYHGKNTPCEPCVVSPVFETGIACESEQTFRDGHAYRLYHYPYTDIDGSTLILELGVDITDRKQAEEALQRSESKFRSLAETSASAIVIYRDAKLSYVNPAAEAITGYSEEELLGMSFLDIIHPAYRKLVGERSQSRLRGEEIVSRYEFQIITKDGEERWLDGAGTVIEIDGQVSGLASMLDITERRRAEEERAQLASAIEQAAEGVLIVGCDQNILYVNPAFENLHGAGGKNLVGMPLASIGGEYCREVFQQAMESCFAVGEAWSERLERRNIAGRSVVLDVSISPVRSESGAITRCVMIQRDVTNEMKLETKLRQAQKMEAIGTLAGGIAHDFNNILSIIFSFTELAELALPESPEATLVREHLAYILQAGERAKDLVKQILAFSRQGEQESRPIEIGLVVKETLKLLRASLPSTIEVRRDVRTRSMVIGDPGQIQQVLMNLCTNSAHAMRDHGGILMVSLTDVTVDEGFAARHPGVGLGPYLKLSVSDTGCGIDMDTLERIFDPYFTTKGPGEGTGLGLAVVHGIVKRHGGIINVYSELGKGCTFDIFLPVLKQEAEGLADPTARFIRRPPGGTERILFVDDEEGMCRAAKQMLDDLGYDTTIRTSSIEALEAFRAQPDRFDLVVTDLTMPQMTGLDLARRIRRIDSSVPIVLCTGFGSILARDAVEAAGVSRLASKPLIREELAGIIRSVLDESPRSVG